MERYAADQTFLSGRKLKALTSQYPTPFYLYDEAGIRREAEDLNHAFSWSAGFCQFFPVSLCPNRAILSILKEKHCGVLCQSPREMALARELDLSADQILYSGADDQGQDCVYILDGFHALPPKPPQRALLRYNPGGKLQYGAKAAANLDRIRLGMDKDELLRLAVHLAQFGTKSLGLSFSGLSNELRPEYYPAVAKLLFELAAELHSRTGLRIFACCLGDGFGVSYRKDAPSPDLLTCAGTIRQLFEQILVPAGLGDTAVYTTLGRRLLAPNGILLTRVAGIKLRKYPTLILDVAASQFPEGGSLHHHHISLAGNDALHGRAVYAAAGCQCDNQLFSESCLLPTVKVGSVLVFHTAGCVHSLSVPGLGYVLAPEYLLHTDGTVDRI